MKIVKDIDNYDNEQYIWYACYGSNINYDRFKRYIKGDEFGKGCKDKSLPIESRKYTFNNPIYFMGTSKKWSGSVAFLDYKSNGKAYGKIYKIKLNQFKDIFNQEAINDLYDTILLIDNIDNLPVFTFTSKEKYDELINKPSKEYLDVINKGIKETYKENL